MRSDPTIFALATPRQPAARAVIRISGAASESIFAGACGSTTLATALGSVPAAIWRFPAGASATGEACCELHLPGNLWLIDSVEAMLRDAGLQHAAPGEFTRRAYLNGVLDLASAEAVMALVSSSDRQAARRARAQASGKVSRDIRALTADLEDLCARFEVSFDFDEEAADQVDETRFLRASEVLASRLRAIAGTPQLGRTEVPRIVMAGEANAGKSTLFNALLGRTRAAVADVSGTTRDVVSETLHLQGMNVLLQDTAGLKRPSSGPDSAIEQDALHQTRESVLRADLLLLVVPAPLSGDHDLSTAWHDWCRADSNLPTRCLLVRTMLDRGEFQEPADESLRELPTLAISARNGVGMAELRLELEARLRSSLCPDTSAVSARAFALLQEASELLESARHALADSVGLEVASDMGRQALRCLREYLGDAPSSDVLDHIFSHFCIGK